MIYILKAAIANRDSLAHLRARSELRKATEQMLWAFDAASRCLESFPLRRDQLGLVVGSGQGELETTKEYYKSLSREGTARPFLFQNSLHHSTTGMLSQALQITGAGATVSAGFHSGESALELAISFLESGQCAACLVVGVDTLVPELKLGIDTLYPANLERGEGAAALLVALEEGYRFIGGTPAFAIESFNRSEERTAVPMETLRGYYEADGLAKLIDGARNGAEVILPKPDGSAAHFRLRRTI